MTNHKYYDFTQTGGFPFTQDILKRMQESDVEALLGWIAAGGDTTGPMRVSGMDITISGSDVTVTDGWFVYNDDLIEFAGTTVTLGGGEVALVEITTASSTLIFNDGSTPGVQKAKTATLIADPTATTATLFPILDIKPFGRERDWTEVTSFVSTLGGTVTGAIYYKKNTLNNTLHIRGSLGIDVSTFVSALPSSSITKIYTFPSGYRPTSDAVFIAPVAPGFYVKTSDNVSWLRYVTMRVEGVTGTIVIECLKTDADASYEVEFDATILLD